MLACIIYALFTNLLFYLFFFMKADSSLHNSFYREGKKMALTLVTEINPSQPHEIPTFYKSNISWSQKGY